MDGHCRCGNEVRNGFHTFACYDCGAACCPACAIHLESTTYCHACAGALLDTATPRAGSPFEIQ
jgi:hypothetical protein